MSFCLVAKADENVVTQVLDPQPIIAVEDVKPSPSSTSPSLEPVVDTEAASPIAPQSFDGYGGIPQEAFAPTVVEKQALLKRKEQEAQKERELLAQAEANRQLASSSIQNKKSVATVTAKQPPAKRKELASQPSRAKKLSPRRKVASTPRPAPSLRRSKKSAIVKK